MPILQYSTLNTKFHRWDDFWSLYDTPAINLSLIYPQQLFHSSTCCVFFFLSSRVVLFCGSVMVCILQCRYISVHESFVNSTFWQIQARLLKAVSNLSDRQLRIFRDHGESSLLQSAVEVFLGLPAPSRLMSRLVHSLFLMTLHTVDYANTKVWPISLMVLCLIFELIIQ